MSTEEEHLHEDIVVNMILCRLPVKSLIRCTCVCKRWRAVIISDLQFGRYQLQLASQQKTLSQRLLISTYPIIHSDGLSSPSIPQPSRFQSLEEHSDTPFCVDGNSLVRNLSFPSEEMTQQRVLASCNGLVVLGQLFHNWCIDMSLWNPTTGFFRKIPCPDLRMEEGENKYLGSVNYGFGHLLATDDYKLVFVESTYPHFLHNSCLQEFVEVHIFSFKANSWRVMKAPYLWCIGWNESLSVSNGAVHWVNNPRDSDPSIYALDLAKEEFRQVPLPPLVYNENESSLRHLACRDLLGGCLCVWFQEGEEYEHNEFWAMTKYGVPESWVKLFQFDQQDLPCLFASCCDWDPVYVTEGGTILIKLLHKELINIECHKEEEPVCITRYRLEEVPGCSFEFDVTVYDETLVSVA